MSYRRAHGKAADRGAVAVIETAAPDELPAAVPAAAPLAAERQSSGKFTKGPGTSAHAAAGGRGKAEAAKFRRLLGLLELDDAHPYGKYLQLAREHQAEHSVALATDVGGGQLSPGTASIAASASLALAASRYLYDLAAETCSPKLLIAAAKLADSSRTALITCHELAAREAAGRPRRNALHDRILGAGSAPARASENEPEREK